MRRPVIRSAAVIASAVAFAALIAPSNAGPPLISTTITYQGELRSSNALFNGLADFQFSLYDVLAGGVALAGPNQLNNVTVLDGRFTVPLTFGSNVFDGSNRYLEIGVRIPTGVGGFTTLSPRQRITAAPYSLQTRGMFVSSGGFAGIGTPDPQARLHVDDGSDSAPASGGYLVIGDVIGPNLSLDNNEIMARNNGAAATLALNAEGGDVNILQFGGGNVGIGTSAADARLHVVGGFDASPGSGGQVVIGNTASLNLAMDNNEIMARNNGVVSALALNAAGSDVNLVPNGGGNVGIGTSAADARLHVVGGGDVSPGSGGQVVIGNTNATNIAMDSNEIMARNNGGTSTLYLNAQGGTVAVGNTAFVNLDVTGNISGATLGAEFVGTINTNNHAALFGRNGGNGNLVQWVQNNNPCGAVAVINGEVIYGPFTGSHYGWVDANQPPIEHGTLMTMTGSNRRLNADPQSEIVYGIAPTALANDPACLGAYLDVQESTAPAGDGNPHLVMAVGNGEMWVVDDGRGDIEPGEYLVSSYVPGCAMKDDHLRFSVGHIVAQAAERVQWSDIATDETGHRRAKISVLFEKFDRHSERSEIATLRAENDALRARLDALERAVAERHSQPKE